MKFDITLLTEDRYVSPAESNEYIDNILKEDQLVSDALEKKGFKVTRKSWADTSFEWADTSYVLFRTTWDYAERFREFSDWLTQVAYKTKMINSYDLISWNLDKHYLDDLKNNGVRTVETYFIEPKDPRTLAELHHELKLDHTVLKPAISAAARDTYELHSDNLSFHQDRFSELIKDESMLLQPFQKNVVERGEISLMVIGGEYTHGTLKKAVPGDFRVQDDFGGSVEDYTPTNEEVELAVQAVNAYHEVPVYARVDIVNDNEGIPAISELELIEPELWFRNNEGAADKLADAVVKYIQK